MRVAALTFGALGVVTRRRTAETVLTTLFAAVFTGVFLTLATGLPALERYLFFFDFVAGGVVFLVAGSAAPRHTPTATSTANPTLGHKIIL
jgi:hypothetical protein